MIIGIDVSSIPYGTGVSNYTLNLIRNLIKTDKKNSYKFFFSSLRLNVPKEIIELSENNNNVKLYKFKLPLSLLSFIWNKLHIFPIEIFIGDCDVFHTSDWTQPPSIKAKLITTVHDLTPFLYPQWHNKKIINTHAAKMYWAVKQCSGFICVSENTKNDLIKLFPSVSKKNITTIYEAAENKYNKFIKISEEVQNQKINTIKKQYGLKRYIFAQGTREPRKNLDNLISAFQIFRSKHPESTVELAIAGKYGWGKDIQISDKKSIKILGYIPEKSMVPLHAGAICLAYPSFYEGFGLPLIKSIAVGTPIITSKNSSMSEIIGDAGILINPSSPEDIAHALEKLICSTKNRKRFSLKGLQQAKQFSWTKTAKLTLKFYETIC